jgi:hypothetical protein
MDRGVVERQCAKCDTSVRAKVIDFLILSIYINYWSDRSIEALAPTALPRPQGPSRDAEISLTAKVVIEWTFGAPSGAPIFCAET